MVRTESPGQTRRARRREARRNEMLDAAMRIVLDQGVDALTIAKLAKDIDAAVGALYRYFPGKGGLMVALQERAILALGDALTRDVERARRKVSSETWERAEVLALVPVLAAFRGYTDFAVAEPATYALIDASLSDPRALLDDDEAAAIQGVLDPILQSCAGLLDDAATARALDSGDALARTHVLWGSLHGLGHFRKRDARLPDELGSDALVSDLIRSLLLGWGASGSDIDAAAKRL